MIPYAGIEVAEEEISEVKEYRKVWIFKRMLFPWIYLGVYITVMIIANINHARLGTNVRCLRKLTPKMLDPVAINSSAPLMVSIFFHSIKICGLRICKLHLCIIVLQAVIEAMR
jgi:hypothetical protein